MSQPDSSVRRALHNDPARAFSPSGSLKGLHGIGGLSFAYRLNQWGPKTQVPMIPANTFRTGYAAPPALSGLASPITWFEGLLGVESPANMVSDANTSMQSALTPLNGMQTTIQGLLTQAQGYDSSTDVTVQSKAQACEAEATGVLNNYSSLQSAAQGIINAIAAASQDPNVTKDTATNLQAQVSAFSSNVSTLQTAVKQLTSDVNALMKYAQSGPGVVQTLENTAVSSISTLTWILGGGALVYFLAPSFLPRLVGGIRKARTS